MRQLELSPCIVGLRRFVAGGLVGSGTEGAPEEADSLVQSVGGAAKSKKKKKNRHQHSPPCGWRGREKEPKVKSVNVARGVEQRALETIATRRALRTG